MEMTRMPEDEAEVTEVTEVEAIMNIDNHQTNTDKNLIKIHISNNSLKSKTQLKIRQKSGL